MQLSSRQIARLQSIVDTAQKILTDASKAAPAGARTKSGRGQGNYGPTRRRRGADLVAFKKMIKAERKEGRVGRRPRRKVWGNAVLHLSDALIGHDVSHCRLLFEA